MFDAAMAGVMGGELAEQFGETALEIFGPVAALGAGRPTRRRIPIPGGGVVRIHSAPVDHVLGRRRDQ